MGRTPVLIGAQRRSALPEGFRPHLDGPCLLVASAQVPPVASTHVRLVASGDVRRGTTVHLLCAGDLTQARAAVAELRAAGCAATLGPADASHLSGWETRNQPTWVTTQHAICFPWVACDVPTVVEIDPGAAFGTGNHPTTLLLLRWLANVLPGEPAARVLDVGTGSGVLALFAAALGASHVVGTDIATDALEAATANAIRNDLGGVARFCAEPFDQLPDLPCNAPFDVLVANLDAPTLQHLAPRLAAAVRPGGWLALSGISAAQTSLTAAAFRPHGICFETLRLDDYCALTGSRPVPGDT